jgi:hypothetical protein
MAVHLPPILVLIACKVVMAANPDLNAGFTHVEKTQWATKDSMMICQRHEVDLYDPVEGMSPTKLTILCLHLAPTLPTTSNVPEPVSCRRCIGINVACLPPTRNRDDEGSEGEDDA